MNRWKVALAPAEPAYPNDAGRRLPPGKARRRDRGISVRLLQSERSAETTTVPLAR
jgi:hypothetical protein